jgi:hypothetical protein
MDMGDDARRKQSCSEAEALGCLVLWSCLVTARLDFPPMWHFRVALVEERRERKCHDHHRSHRTLVGLCYLGTVALEIELLSNRPTSTSV